MLYLGNERVKLNVSLRTTPLMSARLQGRQRRGEAVWSGSERHRPV